MGKIFSNLKNRHSVLVFYNIFSKFYAPKGKESEGMENNLKFTILEN